MTINCDVIVQWSATPDQLRALGAALWRWCSHEAGGGGLYQLLDNQPLADLVAGRLPASSQTPWQADLRGVHFRARDGSSPNRQAAIDRLRRDLPSAGVEDILIDGASWAQTA